MKENRDIKDGVGELVEIGDVIAYSKMYARSFFKKGIILSFTKSGMPRVMTKEVGVPHVVRSNFIKTFNQNNE